MLLQLETPLETVAAAAATARAAGAIVVLNAAPIRTLSPALLQSVDVLVVNEHEAALLVEDLRDEDPAGLSEQALASALAESRSGRISYKPSRVPTKAHSSTSFPF